MKKKSIQEFTSSLLESELDTNGILMSKKSFGGDSEEEPNAVCTNYDSMTCTHNYVRCINYVSLCNLYVNSNICADDSIHLPNGNCLACQTKKIETS